MLDVFREANKVVDGFDNEVLPPIVLTECFSFTNPME